MCCIFQNSALHFVGGQRDLFLTPSERVAENGLLPTSCSSSASIYCSVHPLSVSLSFQIQYIVWIRSSFMLASSFVFPVSSLLSLRILVIFAYFKMVLFTDLSLAVLGLCHYVGFSLVTGYSLAAVCRLLLAVASLVAEHGLEGALATVVGAHGLSCSTACGSFLDQGSNPCLLHWKVDFLPLSHQGSPICYIYFKCLFLWSISSLSFDTGSSVHSLSFITGTLLRHLSIFPSWTHVFLEPSTTLAGSVSLGSQRVCLKATTPLSLSQPGNTLSQWIFQNLLPRHFLFQGLPPSRNSPSLGRGNIQVCLAWMPLYLLQCCLPIPG